MITPNPQIVLGVVPDLPAGLVTTAASFAAAFGAELTCAYVDPHRRTLETHSDGTVVSTSANDEVLDERVETFDPGLRSLIGTQLDGHAVTWSVRALAGEATAELTHLADRLDATMIIIGARRPGVGGRLRELMGGTTAVQLTHHQHRPVVVVPHAFTRRHEHG